MRKPRFIDLNINNSDQNRSLSILRIIDSVETTEVQPVLKEYKHICICSWQ